MSVRWLILAEMIAVTILALCAVPALGNPIKPADSIPGYVKDTLLEVVSAERDATSFLAWELIEFNRDFNAVLKKTLENFVLLGSPAIEFGKNGIQHFFDIGNYFISGFPIIGSAVDLGIKAIEIKFKLYSALRAYLLNSAKIIAETNLDILTGVGDTFLEALEDASNHTSKIIKEAISSDMDTFNGAVKTVNEAIHKE